MEISRMSRKFAQVSVKMKMAVFIIDGPLISYKMAISVPKKVFEISEIISFF